MIKFSHVVALALVPAAISLAGVEFSSHQNGADRPSWGRPAQNSWGQSNFIVNNSNGLAGGEAQPISEPTGTFDPIHGFGADNSGFYGLQVKGPGGTRIIYDRLVGQQVVHVLGGDIDDQIGSTEDPHEMNPLHRPEIDGAFLISGSQLQSSSPPGDLPPPPPVPTPEPTSAALLGVAAWMLGLRRPTRNRA